MATYRLQFNASFRLADGQALIPYCSRLGITHIYASPLLRARSGSTHGYDVVDPTTLYPALGDKADLVQFATTLQNHGLSLLLDIVPNHAAATLENPYWRDVLTYGSSSPFAHWFDIDWRMPERELWGRVLVPVLGAPLSRVLQRDEIRLVWSEGRFLVRYLDHAFPVDPATVPRICEFGQSRLVQPVGADPLAMEALVAIVNNLKKLPKQITRLRRHVTIDREQTEQWLAQFAQLVIQSPRFQQWAEETAHDFGVGEGGRQRLRRLLEGQPYRLVHWRDAARKINYRRFFDINELIALRQENPQVFQDTHAEILRWIEEGLVHALRVDHIDGLRDPAGYLQRLTDAVAARSKRGRLPIFVEKILATGEDVPDDWPIEGTTGYDFLNQVEALFVSPTGLAELEGFYRSLVRRHRSFDEMAAAAKRRVLKNELSPHVGRLADHLGRILAECRSLRKTPARAEYIHEHLGSAQAGEGASSNLAARQAVGALAAAAAPDRSQWTKPELVAALVEVMVHLPVYRTYGGNQPFRSADRAHLTQALATAARSGRAEPGAVETVGRALMPDREGNLSEHEWTECASLLQRFQQVTGPAAAKGIEDSALYSYVPLVSLNEVGGGPQPFPQDAIAVFHQAAAERADRWPRAMLCTTTHDTKRTADVRARLDVLSEIPRFWAALVRRWNRSNRAHRSLVDGRRSPDNVDMYLFYQSLVGIWPAPSPADPTRLPDAESIWSVRKRLEEYMRKGAREAKRHTSWTRPNLPYEEALICFVRSCLWYDGRSVSPFLGDVQHLVSRIARPGFWNSLARTLVQFTAPGTPDLYQGDELWQFSLVDPDNRRPVDFPNRQVLLDHVITRFEAGDTERLLFLQELVDGPEDGRIKQHVIRGALSARRRYPELFAEGRYVPLAAKGSARGQVLAFARMTDAQAALVVVPRLTIDRVPSWGQPPTGDAVWGDTVVQLPSHWGQRSWWSALTGQSHTGAESSEIPVAELLRQLPVALWLG